MLCFCMQSLNSTFENEPFGLVLRAGRVLGGVFVFRWEVLCLNGGLTFAGNSEMY